WDAGRPPRREGSTGRWLTQSGRFSRREEWSMRDRKSWGVVGGLALVVAVALAVVGVTTASGAKSAKKPIVIGFAADLSGQMAPFDNPALTAAKLEAAKINAAGGVNGAQLKIVACDTQNSKPAVSKSRVSHLGSR